MKQIDGGVIAAKGFTAAGVRAGIKKNKTNKDMAMVFSEVPATTAATFTLNVVKAAPVFWDKKLVEEQETAQVVVVNTGYANACTGEEGLQNVEKTAELVGEAFGIAKDQVLVASTGVIAQQVPMDAIAAGIPLLKEQLAATAQSAHNAAEAIMTTDTKPKEIAFSFELEGTTVHMGGMCKGSGMIHPNMGTMLGFITTDVAIDKNLLQKALRNSIQDSFNMISVDGDTSTNDTVMVLANGMAGGKKIETEDANYEEFCKVLNEVTLHLAKQIAADGEGCTRLLEAQVVHASSKEQAKVLAKSVITSNLTKAAVFGKDANCGRILCAMGYSGAQFDPNVVDITITSDNGTVQLVKDGMGMEFDEELATSVLSPEKVVIIADIKEGTESATAWGCDLTYEYIKINADYRS